MKLSEVITIWDILRSKPLAELGFRDLADAVETVVGVENDVPVMGAVRGW